jgi:hypothetical protein
MSPVTKVKKGEYDMGLAVGSPNSLNGNEMRLFLIDDQISAGFEK